MILININSSFDVRPIEHQAPATSILYYFSVWTSPLFADWLKNSSPVYLATFQFELIFSSIFHTNCVHAKMMIGEFRASSAGKMRIMQKTENEFDHFYSLHLRAIFTRIRHSFIVKHFHTKVKSYSWDMRMWRITMCNIRFSFSNSGMCFFAFLRSVSKNRWTYSHNCTARFNLKWNDERQRKLEEKNNVCCLFGESISLVLQCRRAQRHSIWFNREKKNGYFHSNVPKDCNLPLVRSHQTFPWKCAPSPGSNWMFDTHSHGIPTDTENLGSVQSNNHGQTHRSSLNLQELDSYNFRWCDDTNWCIHSGECHFFLKGIVEDWNCFQ